MKIIQVSKNKWLDRETMVNLHHRLLFDYLAEIMQIIITWMKPEEYQAEWN